MGLRLHRTPGELAVVRLAADAAAPAWAAGGFVSVTRTDAELSVVCDASAVPETSAASERGWRRLEVRGPLDLGLTGVLAAIAAPLAEAGVPVFVISTYDTDHVLVRADRLADAEAALRAAGHEVDA
ncbi:MAG: ACT domain-containing protein [Thermoleophilia bacterium]|nr:ACT domain-containing protein [Thermoleophilia bacterium]